LWGTQTDRFHLAMNASTCLESIVTREHAHLHRVIQDLREQHRASLPPLPPTVYYHQRESQQRRTRRQDRYEESLALHQQGWSNSAIARYLKAEGFPERRN